MNIDEFFKNGIEFERIVRFPRIPVIFFESMSNCYENNDYAKKLGLKYAPNGVVIQDKDYEGWIDLSSKIKISDLNKIEQIIADSKILIAESKERLKNFIQKSDNIDIDNIEDSILQLNNVSEEIYDHFIFFTDELFYLNDIEKIKELQEIRMEFDDLVINFLIKSYELIIKILNKKFKIEMNVLANATTQEIIRILNKDKNLNTNEIINRPLAIIFIQGKKNIVFNNQAKQIGGYLNRQNPEQAEVKIAKEAGIIKGTVGNSGRVIGKVIKLLVEDYGNKSKLEKMKKNVGYILVTPMTRPELVPYIKNASAFVTDEGGITCHAAIVARELSIPSIVGTKIASSILNDGDLVEVDADNGIVKIIK